MGISGKRQIDLIEDLGINRSTVSSWCAGKRMPSMDKIDILAKYLNVKFSDFIEDKKDEREIEIVATHLKEVEDRAEKLKFVDTQSTKTDKVYEEQYIMRIFICEELINNIESNINKIKKIPTNIDKDNYEAYFIYAFALFESALSEAIRHILRSFPEKINSEKNLLLSAKDIYTNMFSPQKNLETLVENEIRKVSKGSATKIVTEAEIVCAVQLLYDIKRLESISATRNQITHENTPSRQNNYTRVSKLKNETKITENCINDISYLLSILNEFAIKIKEKYGKYTRYKMLKEFWNTLFSTPLLRFEDCVFIREDIIIGDSNKKIVGFNFEHIKKVSNNISSSEKFFLSIILQQYSTSINERFFKFSDIPMLVSISDKEKIYLLLHVMTLYPHLFNGMNMVESLEEDNKLINYIQY